jgi:hypothetical protein
MLAMRQARHPICFVLAITICCAGASAALAGNEGLGRAYKFPGPPRMGRYRFPHSAETAEVPQRPGFGYFPTYWRDWHENAAVAFSEPETTFQPRRKAQPKPEEVLPPPSEDESTTPDVAPNAAPDTEMPPPPPQIPLELPPSEMPEMPSDQMQLPGAAQPGAEPALPGATPEEPMSLPGTEPGAESAVEPTTEPATDPGAEPAAEPGNQVPSIVPAPGEPTTEPAADAPTEAEPMPSSAPTNPGTSEGPRFHRRVESKEKSFARQVRHQQPTPANTEESTLQALSAGFGFGGDSPAVVVPEAVDSAELEVGPAIEAAIEAALEASDEPKPVVIRAAANLPTEIRVAAPGAAPPRAGVRRAAFIERPSLSGVTITDEPAPPRAAWPSGGRSNPLRYRDTEAAAANPLR